MKKDMMRGGIVLAVLLLLYHLIVFLIPFAKTAVFWLSYVFSLVAFAIATIAIYIAFAKRPDAKSKFYGFPIAKVGVIYWLVQFLLGILFMGLGLWAPWWLVVILYAVALGAAVIGLVSADAVVDEIHMQDEKLQKNVALMRSLQSRVSQMVVQTNNSAIKALMEEFRYSDPVSSDAITSAEIELSAAVDKLQAAVSDGNHEEIMSICNRVSMLLSERNRLCKLNK